jgi:hypothetical protein
MQEVKGHSRGAAVYRKRRIHHMQWEPRKQSHGEVY